MHHKMVICFVQKLEKNHDQPVLQWKGILEGRSIEADSISNDEISIDSVFMEVEESTLNSQPAHRYFNRR